MNMNLELIADYECVTGENPLWHPDEKRVYWLDIPTGRMFRYDPASGQHEQCYEGEVVGGFTIQADGALFRLNPGIQGLPALAYLVGVKDTVPENARGQRGIRGLRSA